MDDSAALFLFRKRVEEWQEICYNTSMAFLKGSDSVAMLTRKEMDPRFMWDLSDIFPSREAWEAAYEKTEAEIGTLGDLPGTLKVSKESLKAGLDRIYAVMEPVDLIYRYASLLKSGDNGDPEAQAMESRAMNLSVRLSAALAFVDPEILEIPEETLDGWMKDPLLAEYRHILHDTARTGKHTLPYAQEKMLSLLSDAAENSYNAFTMMESVDMTFPNIAGEDGKPAALTHGTYGVYRESRRESVRKESFEVYHGEFKRFINTFAAMYAGSVKMDTYFSDVRGYGSALERALDGSNVPVAVYDALVEAVHEGLDTMKKYLALRKRVLGLEQLHMYDLYCPMVENVEYSVTFEEGKELVKKALLPLGEGYQKLLDKSYEENWMDVYENKGKTTGAFSCGVHGVHPYVLLNYTNTLDDVYTMAHELGHAMHSYLSSEKNSYANHNYRIMVAEVASTVNEVLMSRYLLKTETDKHRRAYILNHLLESFRTTVFRQTLFAEFERKAHDMYKNNEPLTAESLSRVFRDLNVLYYEGAVVDPLQDVEWARVPHFYEAFYVYQYATGFCSAVAIADGILETGDASDYLKFLSTGGSDYPLEELKVAGVDLTSPEVVRRALKVFDETLAEFEALLDEA